MDITRTLNTNLPLIQSPMAGVQDWRLALSVSEAGGLGSIPCGMLSPEQVEHELRQFTQHSCKPYNLNFFCHEMPEPNAESEQQWLEHLSVYYKELDLELAVPEGALRMPFNAAMADVIEPFKPSIVSFHFGLPSQALVERVKSWGAVVMSSATTVEEGVWLAENGADIVIAQGLEAGGHRGLFKTDDLSTQCSLEALLPQLLSTLSVPVIAAGGIANASDIKRMMDLGAAGVQMGTAFLLCDEANTNAVYRNALQDPDAHTSLTNVFSGRPARGIDNRAMKELGFISPLAPQFPYAASAMGPLRAYANEQGLADFLPMWSGTNRSGCKLVPARELVQSLFTTT